MLLLAAGVEMDAELAGLCGRRRAARRARPRPSAWRWRCCPSAHWSALTPLRPLRRWRLVEVDDAARLVTARLRIDERVLHYLAGVELSRRAPAQSAAPRRAEPAAMADVAAAPWPQRSCAACDRSEAAGCRVVRLAGDDAHGQRDVAAAVARRSVSGCMLLQPVTCPPAAHEIEALATPLGARGDAARRARCWSMQRCAIRAAGALALRRAAARAGLRQLRRAGGARTPGASRFGSTSPARSNSSICGEQALGAGAARARCGRSTASRASSS